MTNTARSTKKEPATRALPAALAKRAKAAHAARRQQLAAAGFAAVEAIRDLRRSVAGDFLEMGRALATLKGDGVAEAMGYATFEALCAKELDLSSTRANLLVALFERLDGALVRSLGADRASALLSLADATPEDDSVADLLHATLTLPSGATIDVERASVKEIEGAAAALRRAGKKAGKKGRGLTVSAAEQKRFEALVKRIGKATGVERVGAKLIATHKESGAEVQVRLPLAAMEVLMRAAAKAAKG